ncbi:MAG: hypothetical protein KAU38_12940, partial [Desulfobacterales bacterium]|nr:hypothetical protein [Desulfobacterales bacterium]
MTDLFRCQFYHRLLIKIAVVVGIGKNYPQTDGISALWEYECKLIFDLDFVQLATLKVQPALKGSAGNLGKLGDIREDLLQKIPEILEKAKKIGRDIGLSDEAIDDLILVFDREGYSAELYRF